MTNQFVLHPESSVVEEGVRPDDIILMQAMTAEGMAWDVTAESLADAHEERAPEAVKSSR